ncbi:MAG: 30S ribosomal protein S7 [Elusimicrobia bacterium]|nr:30S ribosomal protein S7 [Elusimicrobiota bacterium]
MRKKNIKQRKIKKPFVMHDEVMERFVTKVMWDGKKSLAIKICRQAMEIAAGQLKCTPEEALTKALDNIKPLLEVKSRRVGGATYQVPVEVSERRGLQLGMRWLVDFARARKGKAMSEKLAAEIVQAVKGEGSAVKKREDTHKMAEANKAFAHYRW